MAKVLTVVTDKQILELFSNSLRKNNHVPLPYNNYDHLSDNILKNSPDVIVLEYRVKMVDIILRVLNSLHQSFLATKPPIVWVFYQKYDYHIVREHMRGKVDRLVSFPFYPDEEFAIIK